VAERVVHLAGDIYDYQAHKPIGTTPSATYAALA
jgi:hypothetical protein